MTKALVSMYSGDAELVREVTWPPMRRYAERHGYQLVEAEPVTEAGLTVTWSKVPALLGALNDGDYALWLDADVLVTEGAWDVTEELPAGCFQALAYDARVGPCSSIWLVRADGGRAFLERLWARRHEEPQSVDYLAQQLIEHEPETGRGTVPLQSGWGDHEGCCQAPLMVHRGWDAGGLDWSRRLLMLAHEAQRGPRV